MPPVNRPPLKRPPVSSKKPQPLSNTRDLDSLVSEIARFYATKPIGVTYDAPKGYLGQTYPGADAIKLSPEARASLEAMATDPQKGVLGLGTLIHEALHTRGPDGKSTRDARTGLYSWDDEWQARQLSFNLVPDALQRFFGIKHNSPLGQKLYETAKANGYGGTLGSPRDAGVKDPDWMGERSTWW